jgi:hypothetical protein
VGVVIAHAAIAVVVFGMMGSAALLCYVGLSHPLELYRALVI